MKSWLRVLVPVVVFFALAACKKGDPLPDSSTAEAVGAGAGGANTTSSSGSSGLTRSPLEQAEARLPRTLGTHFHYDQAEIKPEFTQVVQAHGQKLASSASMQVRLEGHTDERRSREDNTGLRERRAPP